jgi:hypothetical protein
MKMTEQSDLDEYQDDDNPTEAAAVRILSEAINKGKRTQRVLTACVTGLTALTLFIGVLAVGQYELAHKIQNGSIAQCQAGNSARAANVDTWKFFIGVLIKGDTKPSDLAEAKHIIEFIEARNAPRDCHAIYGASAAL